MGKILWAIGVLLLAQFISTNTLHAESFEKYSPVDKALSGVVSDEENLPIPGVSVVVKGTTIGTSTDASGRFTLTVPDNANLLVFSFIGFDSREVPIGNQSTFNVTLTSQELLEVVVTALGIKREERSLGYAVQEVNAKGMTEARETNFVNALQGKIAGVQISGASGNIGGSSRILIRGASSVSGNNQPLFVVDGTPIDNSNFNSIATQTANGGIDYGNAAQDVNPDDIESVSVLKGPSAAALYGSRASNGVLLITTKSGKREKGIGLSFNSNTTFNNVFILPDYQNEYGGGYKQSFDLYQGQPMVATQADESWGPRLDGRMVRQWESFFPDSPLFGQLTPWVANPDNVRNFYETGITSSNNIALSSGNETGAIRLSYTNMNQTGTMPFSDMTRHSLSVSGNSELTSKLKSTVKVNYVNSQVSGRPVTGDYVGNAAQSVQSSFNTWFQRQLDLEPMKQMYAADGSQRLWNISGPENLSPFYWNNPYWELKEASNRDVRERVFGHVSLSYEFNENFKVTGWARTDFYDFRMESWVPIGHVNISSYLEDIRKLNENNFEFLAQYNKNIGSDFSLNLNVGANKRKQKYYQNYGMTQGGLSVPYFYSLESSIDRPLIEDIYSQLEVNSIYGSTTMGFRDIFYLDATIRNDWSSTLPLDNNSYLYPSVAGSFIFSELLGIDRLLSFGKLRAGWAQVGNDTDPYRLYQTYQPLPAVGSNPLFTVPNTLNNNALKPEISTSYEFGTEFRFLNDRLRLDATYYNISSTNQIILLPVSSTSGNDFNVVNAGNMLNKGVEFVVAGTPISRKSGLSWDITLNVGRNRNEVIELAQGQDNFRLANHRVSINARVGEPYGTIMGTGFALDENGQRLVDNEGFYVREFGKVLGNVLADYTGGINNAFSYKGFTLNALIDFQKGGEMFSGTSSVGTYSGLTVETVGLNEKGNPVREPVADGGGVLSKGVLQSGEPNTRYVEAVDYWKDLSSIHEAHIFDASFVKFRELRFGYTFPQQLFQRLPVQNISLSFVGRNIALLYSKVPHVDPETTLGSGNIQGLENSQLPSMRSLGFNLNIQL